MLHRFKRLCEYAWRRTKASQRVLPTFLIIGTQKGGTTSLLRYLTQHPQVASAFIKEPHFFDFQYSKGLKFYRSHFPRTVEMESQAGAPAISHVGEASPYYLFHPLSPGRVHQILPDVKIIVLLRNPIDRAVSHYLHNVRKGRERRSFEAATASERESGAQKCREMRIEKLPHSQQFRHFSYLCRGFYIDQLRSWSSLFPTHQVMTIQSEEFFQNTPAVFLRVLQFLRIDPWQPAEGFPVHNSGLKKQISCQLRMELSRFYSAANKELFEFLEEDYAWDLWSHKEEHAA